MSRFDARIAKLEASIGQADESRYWRAYAALQDQKTEIYWQGHREGWPVLRFLDEWKTLEKDLPPFPKRKSSTREERERAIQDILEKLNGYADRLEHTIAEKTLDELTQEIRRENERYLRQRNSLEA